MSTYEIPRNVKGEGRILMIFSTKSLVATSVGAAIGLFIYYILKEMFGLGTVGLIITLVFALIGFIITSLKVPESNNFAITRKTGGEKMDDVILRAIKFKQKGKRIYVYTKEENKK